jgi:hypothetical protein
MGTHFLSTQEGRSIAFSLPAGNQCPLAEGRIPRVTIDSRQQAKLMLREETRRPRSPGYFQTFIDPLKTSRDDPWPDIQCLRNFFICLSGCNM